MKRQIELSNDEQKRSEAFDSRMRLGTARTTTRTFGLWACSWVVLLLLGSAAHAQTAENLDRARRMHDRLAGVPPDDTTLTDMALLIEADDAGAAATLAMTNPNFYNVVLKNWITPWTNEAQTVFAPLNDYTATVIGMIRDDLPFNTVLTDDILYHAEGAVPSDYSQTDNDHYIELEEQGINLGIGGPLIRDFQSQMDGNQLDESEAAGVTTTRAAGEAFFSAGTNRAMFRFTSINYLCRDLEQLHDVTRAADRIRQDVTRSPGGDSEIFLNTCYGCHAGMDALAGAYAFFEWDADAERVIHTRGVVQPKHLINGNVFPFGFVTTDNGWINYWREGPNATMGWRGASDRGFGAKSLGAELAGSDAFSTCQVEKVFELVCFRPVGSEEDRTAVDNATTAFEESNYSMKGVFADVAEYCMDDPTP
ncbi:MAG: hypothetical protein AB8G23_06220 [Myxococcota bacterium]